jgi:hypothetical protein
MIFKITHDTGVPRHPDTKIVLANSEAEAVAVLNTYLLTKCDSSREWNILKVEVVLRSGLIVIDSKCMPVLNEFCVTETDPTLPVPQRFVHRL